MNAVHDRERAGQGAHWSPAVVERIVPGTPEWDRQYLEHLQRYEFAADHLVPGARVLDAGCGCGYGSALLAGRGAGAVVAVDLSEDALRIGRERFHRETITWVREDCECLESAGSRAPFDLVCNLENFEHLSDPQRFLTRVRELLSPRGILVTSTPNRIGINRLRGMSPDAAPLNPFHVREYSAEEFRTELLAHFEEVSLSFQTFVPLERLHWEPVLLALWHNPALRLGRWLQRVVRRHPAVERIEELLPPPRYQIVATDPGEEFVLTQLAVCRGPRSARSHGG